MERSIERNFNFRVQMVLFNVPNRGRIMNEKITIPPLARVRQKLETDEMADVVSELRVRLNSSPAATEVKKGMRIAVTAGSRGIDRIDEVLRALITYLKAIGAEPFVVPAMGSHGGATAEGQAALLEGFGVSGESTGAPIVSSMDTEVLGEVDGVPVHMDRNALSADGIVLVNRIKPHTSYHGPVESGLLKMLAVGLGKQKGASAIHASGPRALRETVPKIAEFMMGKVNVLFGIALVENGRDRLARMEVIAPEKIFGREQELLKEAYRLMPRLPFREIDVLLVDRLGKSKSGTGLDTNVIGRMCLAGEPEPADPFIRRIVVLDLAEGQGASAYGIGLADITTRRVIDKMDMAAMRENALASTFVERARVPVWFETDEEAVKAAIKTCWTPDEKKLGLVRVVDTLSLEEMLITIPLLERATVDLEVIESSVSLEFDDKGNLAPM